MEWIKEVERGGQGCRKMFVGGGAPATHSKLMGASGFFVIEIMGGECILTCP